MKNQSVIYYQGKWLLKWTHGNPATFTEELAKAKTMSASAAHNTIDMCSQIKRATVYDKAVILATIDKHKPYAATLRDALKPSVKLEDELAGKLADESLWAMYNLISDNAGQVAEAFGFYHLLNGTMRLLEGGLETTESCIKYIEQEIRHVDRLLMDAGFCKQQHASAISQFLAVHDAKGKAKALPVAKKVLQALQDSIPPKYV